MQPSRISKGKFALGLRSQFGEVVLLSLFLNRQNTLFDVRRSMFDVYQFFSIRLAAFQTSGLADTCHQIPGTKIV